MRQEFLEAIASSFENLSDFLEFRPVFSLIEFFQPYF